VIWLATLPDTFRRTLRGVIRFLLLAVALSLLAAPLHRVLEQGRAHDQPGRPDQAHHCPVCALVKGQLDTPDFTPASIEFVGGELALPDLEIASPVSHSFDLLPPGRAPPLSVIPS